ncbi:hypothetical protein [Tuberibacillus calidus]|uniref:hypothetical protein n=1 Tax=Tuberibacillus calidus TaxID=340097 RepID=UPI00040FCE43|nr:hypothetical protein [Tuberibacillus calidus]
MKHKVYTLLAFVIFICVIVYCIHLRVQNHKLEGYVNENLNNLLKPIELDLQQNQDILNKAISSGAISKMDLQSLSLLLNDIVINLNDLMTIESHIADTEEAGSITKELLFREKKYIDSIRGGLTRLNEEQLQSFKKMKAIHSTLLNIYADEDIAKTHFKVTNEKWLTVLRRMDQDIVKKDLVGAF